VVLILAAVVPVLGITAAFGHTTGLSTGDLKFGTNGLVAEVTLAEADLILALTDLAKGKPADANGDGKLTPEEFAAGLERVRKFAQDCLRVEFNGQPVRPSSVKLALDDQANFHIELICPGGRPTRLRLRAALFAHLPPDHMHFLSVLDTDDKPLGKKMLRPDDDSLELVLSAEAAKAERRVSTFPDFLKLGVRHIWTGYDHLMFLLALLLVCSNFKSAVQVVTFFTIAHSITLAFATLNLVWMSSRVVEPAIAASIVYVAVENFVQSEDPKGRWRITFLFGLIHGFGFASVLRDLGVASSSTGVTVPLVAFNLGVESGQIVVAGVLLPVIWKLRKWDLFLRRGVPVCSAVVAAVGGYWLIQRLFFN
jgi:hydrogenase/urease accessory protein HupE